MRRPIPRSIRLLPCVLAACTTAPSVPPPAEPTHGHAHEAQSASIANHAVGVQNAALAALLQRHWEDRLATRPRLATSLGDHRYDGELADNSRAGIAARRVADRAFVEQAKAIRGLDDDDETTRRLFVRMLEDDLDRAVCRFEEWSLSPRGNPITEFNFLADLHRVIDFEDAQLLVHRYEKAQGYIDNVTDHLRRGVKAGLFANGESTRRVLAMVDKQLKQPVTEWPMYAPANVERPAWTRLQRAGFRSGLEDALAKGVKPALERYRDFIKTEILPRARGDDAPGLSPLPFAGPCYEARIRAYTTLPKTARQIHETGLREIARVNRQMQALGKKLFGTDDLAAIVKRLRTDRELYFDSAEAIEAKAEASLAKARAAIASYFGILPQAQCAVARIPEYSAPYTTTAYYRPAEPNGARPGRYFINVYAPETRPRFEMEVLSFHESIPGHHLQIAISQERSALPAFRRHMGMTAFVEGWALYTEQLADEMGLYTGDLDRMGMHSFEAWRAARLVVDTGLHTMGWSRDRAKRFMLEHTALAPNNIDNEVDRYIVWPGQAVAYKTGQLEIWRLRRDAERRLNDRFDLKGFHDAVLGRGAVSLPILEKQVETWVRSIASRRR